MSEKTIPYGYIVTVDDQDADLLSLRWYADGRASNLYAIAHIPDGKGRQKRVQLHRLVLERIVGCPLGTRECCDHINGNTFDNRRCNLRVASLSQNNQNRRLSDRNSSGVKGVFWDKWNQRWRALITLNGRKMYLGSFHDFEDAVNARRTAEIDLFGEYSTLLSRKEENA